jgi:hypothetical protein
MKKILAVLVVVAITGFAAGSSAQQPKKLPVHPEAASNGQTSKGEAPGNFKGNHPGETGGTASRPSTGATVPSGGSSTALSKPN